MYRFLLICHKTVICAIIKLSENCQFDLKWQFCDTFHSGYGNNFMKQSPHKTVTKMSEVRFWQICDSFRTVLWQFFASDSFMTVIWQICDRFMKILGPTLTLSTKRWPKFGDGVANNNPHKGVGDLGERGGLGAGARRARWKEGGVQKEEVQQAD